MRDLFGNEDPFSDFFHAFFSGGGEPEMRGRGGRAGTRARARQGRDVEHTIDLSLEDAYRGTTRRSVSQARRPLSNGRRTNSARRR